MQNCKSVIFHLIAPLVDNVDQGYISKYNVVLLLFLSQICRKPRAVAHGQIMGGEGASLLFW